MKACGKILDLPPSANFQQLGEYIKQLGIDGVISGPETPLAEGLADFLLTIHIPTFGPVQAGAKLESSKKFAKEVMAAAGVPTAGFEIATQETDCREIAFRKLAENSGVVLKASGLAGGKGVFVCSSKEEIENGLHHLFHSSMNKAAQTVVVEDLLVGRECSYFTFIGQGQATGLGFAVDFKRLNEGDKGPNTGGMGCYAPVPWLPENAGQVVESTIVSPVIKELKSRGIDYCGCLYVGLMWNGAAFSVVEFNVRLGDPEAQVLAYYDNRDWLALMANAMGLPVASEALAAAKTPVNSKDKAVVVTVASKGYPYGGEDSAPVELDAELFSCQNPQAFAASVIDKEGKIITGSGRVLSVLGSGASFEAARLQAYGTIEGISKKWIGCQWRKDIAKRVSEENQ